MKLAAMMIWWQMEWCVDAGP